MVHHVTLILRYTVVVYFPLADLVRICSIKRKRKNRTTDHDGSPPKRVIAAETSEDLSDIRFGEITGRKQCIWLSKAVTMNDFLARHKANQSHHGGAPVGCRETHAMARMGHGSGHGVAG
jgi:hypothetical protein